MEGAELKAARARAWRETPEPPRDPFMESIACMVGKQHDFMLKQQDRLIAEVAALVRGEP